MIMETTAAIEKSLDSVTVLGLSQQYTMIDYLWEKREMIEKLYDNYDRIRVKTMQKSKPLVSPLDDILHKYAL